MQGGSGKANGFLFENLNMTDVQYPIDIDQFYCPPGNCPPQVTELITTMSLHHINTYFELICVHFVVFAGSRCGHI
jgi:hypothetical protein